MDVFEAVDSRLSCRAFLDRPVDPALVRDLIARAARAASGGNLQPWRVYALTGAPLKELKPQGARVYLGAIHSMEGFKKRITTARKYLPDFGLGAYCGFGRLPVAELPNVLADHIKAAEIAGLH